MHQALSVSILSQKIFGLKTTTPNLDFDNPLSMERRKLSPTCNSNSSNQTRKPYLDRASARARANSLSSKAWLQKHPKSLAYPPKTPAPHTRPTQRGAHCKSPPA